MDKASKWFRSILGPKRRDTHNNNNKPSPSSKRRWSFVKTYRENNSSTVTTAANSNATQPREGTNGGGCDDSADHNNNKHAIAVASATAAVAEAAVAAAQAAAAVIRLTGSSGRCARDTVTHCAREESATVKIQSTFRGYLARRALRALKGLVRLQALVRGYIVRKRSREWLRKMRALLQAQARARAGRVQISEYSRLSSKSSHFHHPGPPTPEKFEYDIQQMSKKYEQSSMLKRNDSKLSGRTLDNYEHIGEESCVQRVHSTRIGPTNDEKNDKILGVNTGKSCFASKRRNLFHSTHLELSSDQYSCSFTNSRDSAVKSFNPFKYSNEVEESPFCTADNSPNFYSASSKGGSSKRSPFTPAKSDGSRNYLNSYSDHPNYMSYTESSRAKARSISAPKLRPQQDRSCSRKGYPIHGSSELKSHTLKSAFRANLASKAYPGSGRLDRLGMPVEYRC